jgi:hypothetical protein
VDFEMVDTDENGDQRCRVTITDQETGRVALGFLVTGEEWAMGLADTLATVLSTPGVEALWYPGEEPRYRPDTDADVAQ